NVASCSERGLGVGKRGAWTPPGVPGGDGSVGEAEPDDAGDEDGEPGGAGGGEGFGEEDGGEEGGADGAAACPGGISGRDVDGAQGAAEAVEGEQEEDGCHEGPGEVGEAMAAGDGQGVAHLERSGEQEHPPGACGCGGLG